jgi:hypothetical protein
LATNKKFLKRRPLLRYIAICKRRWNLTSDSCRAYLHSPPAERKFLTHFSHVSHGFTQEGRYLRMRTLMITKPVLTLSLSLLRHSGCSFTKFLPREKECEFWICFLMDCFARVLHCLPYNFASSISSVWSSTTYKKSLATMNQQHPPVQHEGWMVSSQETVFCWVPVP